MKRDSFIVTPENGPRPAGKPDECFYCHAKLGEEHKKSERPGGDGCVLRTRTVVVRFQTEIVMSFPEDWDASMVEFNLNDGSRCANNTVEALSAALSARSDREAGCLCTMGNTKHTFLREATEEEDVDCGVNDAGKVMS